MRIPKFIYAASLVFCILSSCGEQLDQQYTASSDYLTVNDIVVKGGETNATLSIKSNCSWTISEDADWLSASPVQGDGDAEVSLTIEVNPSSEEERACELIVSTPDGISKTVNLKQGRSDESLTVSTNSLSFGESGGTNNVTISSNTTWTITGGAEWFSYTPSTGTGNGSVLLAIETNNTEFSREAILTVTGSGGSIQTIAVSQLEKTVSLTIQPEKISATAVADDYTFKILGNASWGITVDDDSWLSLGTTQGSNEEIITVSLKDNNSFSQRSAQITVRTVSGKIERICTVTQAAATVPSPGSVTVSGIGRYTAALASDFTSPIQVTEYGFVWSLNGNPTLENCGDNIVSSNTEGIVSFEQTEASGKNDVVTGGNFSASISGLKSGATYHVRSYARNAAGVGYGAEITFDTGGNIPGENDNPEPDL